jgi:hypothetical protein
LGNVEFRIGEALRPYFMSRAETWSACYVLQIPDSGWGIASGEGALLAVRLSLSTIEDLQNILGYLHEKFGLSNNGMFSIHQSGACWYGVGADNLVRAIVSWQERYEESHLRRVHHSESFCYFDHFRSGWISISSQQRVGLKGEGIRSSFLHKSDLSIQLPGIPVDMTPFLNLCRYTGNDWAHFEHVGRKLTHGRRLKKAIRLDVVGEAVSTLDDERVVVGVIAKNPFFRKKSLPIELQCDDLSGLVDLNRTELLLCSLQDWHDEGMVVDRYMLQGIEATWTYREQMVRPFGTWNRIIESAPDTEASGYLRQTD